MELAIYQFNEVTFNFCVCIYLFIYMKLNGKRANYHVGVITKVYCVCGFQ